VPGKITPTAENIALPIAIGVALLLRVIYWISAADEPWFQTPGMDPEFYHNWAAAILSGHGSDFIPFPRAPLYPYLLAGITRFFGSWWLLPRLFNLACDVTSIWAVWTLARSVAGVRGCFLAALFFALSGMAIYQSGELLMTSLETALAALFLLSLIKCLESRRIRDGILTGFLVALFILCRPNGLLLVFFVPVILTFASKRHNGNSLGPAVSSILAAIICLAPVTYLNYEATGKLVPVATQGGGNFFIGNARGSNGWSSTLPGVGADWTDADAGRLAEIDAGRPLNPYEQSQQLWKMGFAEIKSDPSGWLGLMLRKLLLAHNIRVIGNNRPLTLPTESAPFLKLLFLVSLGGLFPFALVGIIQSLKFHSFITGSMSFIVIFGGSLLLFFISSRYLMPLLPVHCVFAGIGVAHLTKYPRNVFRSPAFPAILAGLAIALPPWGGAKFDNPAQGYYVVGNALLKQGRFADARRYYDRTAALEPGYPKLHLNQGVAFMAEGDTSEAITEFDKELSLFPNRGEALNNLAVIAEKRGEYLVARQLYQRSFSMPSGGRDAGENLLRLLLISGDRFFQQGELDSAKVLYRTAISLSSNDPRLFYRLALVLATEGSVEEARENARQALTLKPDFQPALELLKELPRPQ